MSKTVTVFIIFLSLIACNLYASSTDDKNPGKQGKRTERIINSVPYRPQGPPISYSMSSLSESFESTTFPPAGWSHAELTGGTGWNRQTVGTSPLPGHLSSLIIWSVSYIVFVVSLTSIRTTSFQHCPGCSVIGRFG